MFSCTLNASQFWLSILPNPTLKLFCRFSRVKIKFLAFFFFLAFSENIAHKWKTYTVQRWSNFHFTSLCMFTKRFASLKAKTFRRKKKAFSRENEEICHLDAAQTSTSLVTVYAEASFFVTRLYDCHIFDRKKDIYFLLHLLVIFFFPIHDNNFQGFFPAIFLYSHFVRFISFYSIFSIRFLPSYVRPLLKLFLFSCPSTFFHVYIFIGCYKLIFNEEIKAKEGKSENFLALEERN